MGLKSSLIGNQADTKTSSFQTPKKTSRMMSDAPFVQTKSTKTTSTKPKDKPTTDPKPNQKNTPAKNEQAKTKVSPESLTEKLPQTIQEELIVDWVAAARPYKRRSRQFFSTMWAIALLLIIILIFANQVIFAMVIASLAFMAHLMFRVPPGNIYYALTTFGVRVGEGLYFWEELNHYWFDTKYGQRVLMIDSIRFPHRLTLVIFPEDEEILRRLLSTVLPEFKPKPTLYEKWANWLAKTFPLEEEKSTQTKVENHKPSPSKVNKTTKQHSLKNLKSSQK